MYDDDNRQRYGRAHTHHGYLSFSRSSRAISSPARSVVLVPAARHERASAFGTSRHVRLPSPSYSHRLDRPRGPVFRGSSRSVAAGVSY